MEKANISSSQFKKFIFFLSPWIMLLIAVSFILSIFFEKWIILGNINNDAYKVHRILSETHPKEIPVFGSSRAEGALIPDSISTNIFNYGIEKTQDDVIMFFLSEELKKNKKSPIIVTFDLDGLNRRLGNIDNYIPSVSYPQVEALLDTNCRPLYHIPVLKYYGRWDNYMKYFLSYSGVYNKGAELNTEKPSKKEFEKLVTKRKSTNSKFTNDSSLENTLFKMIDEHQERTFVFVVIPYHSSCFANFTFEKNALSYLEELDKRENVKVFNFSRLELPDSLYANTSHLNVAGAKVFSKIFKDSAARYVPQFFQ